MNIQKDTFLVFLGIIGGTISALFGGWDFALQTLVLFMVVDYITGLMVAGVFKKSQKTDNGSLSSIVGWKGICKKVMSLLLVLIGFKLDGVLNINFLRDGVIIALISNETISIIENAGLMGVPIPSVIKKAIEILNRKKEDSENDK